MAVAAAAAKLAAGEAAGANAAAPAAAAASPPAADAGPMCSGCGTVNAAGMVFCKGCGTALAGSPAGPQGRISCIQCGQPTPAGFTFCQHCGHRLTGAGAANAGAANDKEPAVLRPSPRRRSELPNAEVPPPAVPSNKTPGPALHNVASPEAAKPAVGRPGGSLRGRLIVMRRDGSDGEVINLTGELFDIGRSAAGKAFADDPFLAARHVRFLVNAGGVRVRPLDQVNGVYIQLREPYELAAGDVFYIGRELIRYEPLAPEERDPPPAVEHGVRIFGSTPRESWARLRQLTTGALVRDVWHLSRGEVLLGREEGDIVFPDDEFMSRRHALITRVGGRVRLEDQHSSNGTYVRLRGDRDVLPNDVLRVGDQVLRFEP